MYHRRYHLTVYQVVAAHWAVPNTHLKPRHWVCKTNEKYQVSQWDWWEIWEARLPAGDELLVPALSGDGFRDRPPLNLKSIPMKAADPVTNWWPASSRGQIRISTQCYIGTNTSVRGKAGTPGNMSVHQFCPVALKKVMQWSPNENLSNGRKPQLIGFLSNELPTSLAHLMHEQDGQRPLLQFPK